VIFARVCVCVQVSSLASGGGIHMAHCACLVNRHPGFAR